MGQSRPDLLPVSLCMGHILFLLCFIGQMPMKSDINLLYSWHV